MGLLRSSATVGSYTLISRILGYARDILIAALMGAGPIADAYFVAFKLPNLMRRLFAEGAFNLVFVPQFAGRLEAEGKAAAKAFAEEALALLLWALLVVLGLGELLMPWLMYALAPGFSDDPAKFDLTIELTRITFPYLLFISLVSLLGGVLNSLHRFWVAAAAPILLNLTLIGALLGFARVAETPGHALAIGVSIAGLLQLAWLWHASVRAGFSLKLRRPRLTPAMRRLLVLIVPVALGAGVGQLSVIIDQIFASTIKGGVSFLYYADRINQLPLGVVGVALGTALLPMLARSLKGGRHAEAMGQQNRALEAGLLLALPAAAALVTLAFPLTSVLFERGAFDAQAARESARALLAFALGLPAFVFVKVLLPGFYARSDPWPPVRIAAVCVAMNAALNAALIGPLGVMGIGLATSAAGWLNVALLARGLSRRGYFTLDARLRRNGPCIVIATLIMVGVLELLLWALAPAFALEALAPRAGALAALVLGGLFVYGLAARLLGLVRFNDLLRLFRRTPSQAPGLTE